MKNPKTILLLCVVSIAGILLSCNQEKKSNTAVNTENNSSTEYKPPQVPSNLTSKEEQLNYLFNHYWDNFNFSDTAKIIDSEYAEQAFVNYLAIFPAVSPSQLKEGITDFLDRAKQEQKGFDFFKKKLDSYLYDPNSPMRSDLFYEPVLEYYTSSDKLSADEKTRYRILLDLARKNKVGSTATDFIYQTKEKAINNLHDLENPLILLMFYEPGCSNCEQVIGVLKEQESINQMIANKHMQILAIYPEGNLEIWNDYAANIPSNWINGVDERQEVLNKGLYDLKASPTIYLLDKDKKVILKDTDLNALGNYLASQGL